jgi:proton-translocating NADH-quinone oxidoreductase chain N
MMDLSPIFVLSITIIVMLFSLFVFKIGTKWCTILTVCGLSLALLCSSIMGYKISINNQVITDISSDNMQMPTKSTTEVDLNSSKEETIPVNAASTEPSSTENKSNNVDSNIKVEPNADIDKLQIKQSKVDEDKSIDDNSAESSNSQTMEQKKAPTSPVNDTQTKLADKKSVNVNNKNGQFATSQKTELDNERNINALFTCDGFGLLYTSLILIISIIVTFFAYRWFKQEQKSHGLFYVILLFMTLGGVTLVYASHLMAFFVGIELLSIPFVGLIGYQYIQTHSLEAAVKYMILSAVASAFLLMGIAFYYATTGELTFSGLSYQLSTMTYLSTLLLMGVCLMLVGIGFKLSLVPFQLWLPDVYQGAPTVVALLLSTVGKVAIFCAIARLFLLAPIVNNETIRIILVIMAFCSILWGNLFAFMQSNLKRLLAYSSIAHFGYLLIALIAVQYQVLALETIGVYLIGYILSNICILGVISLESHSNELQDHENEVDLSGLFWRKPILALAMGIGLLSLAGAPLTIGFIGRFLLVLLGVTAELWWLIAAVVIGSALGLYFYARLIINLYIKPTYRDDLLSDFIINIKREKIRLSELFIIFSALLIVICGVYPKWIFSLVNMAQYLTS